MDNTTERLTRESYRMGLVAGVAITVSMMMVYVVLLVLLTQTGGELVLTTDWRLVVTPWMRANAFVMLVVFAIIFRLLLRGPRIVQ
jgi:hypothetical protein